MESKKPSVIIYTIILCAMKKKHCILIYAEVLMKRYAIVSVVKVGSNVHLKIHMFVVIVKWQGESVIFQFPKLS